MTPASVTSVVDTQEAVGLVLSLDEITPFDKDPRQSPNSEYARIKDSILAQGLDQPLVVTRQPGAAQYLIAAGGNTRLKILGELFRETGDPQFARITCVFKPWRGESDVVLAHLRENDLRGGLTFLDRARAVGEVRRMLGIEQGLIGITQAALTKFLKERGYALSQASLSYMEYTVDVLEPLLPLALRAGLGRDHVERIRTFERVTRALWRDRVAADAVDSFDEVFRILCGRYDSPDWDFLSLRQALEAEIAERLNQTVHGVRLALDARLNGVVEDALPKRDEDDEWWPEPAVHKPRAQPDPASSKPRQGATVQSEAQERVRAGGHPEAHESPIAINANSADIDPGTPNPPTTLGADRPMVPHDAYPRAIRRAELPALRAELATVAAGLAARHGLGDLIVTLENLGTGFLVVDVPDPALLAQFDETGLAQVSMIWWQLMAIAEMTVAPIAILLPHLSPESVLYRALREQDAGLLFKAVWTLDPGQIGFRLWRTVSEQDWSDLFTLMSCYRSLHAVAAASNVGLWGDLQ